MIFEVEISEQADSDLREIFEQKTQVDNLTVWKNRY